MCNKVIMNGEEHEFAFAIGDIDELAGVEINDETVTQLNRVLSKVVSLEDSPISQQTWLSAKPKLKEKTREYCERLNKYLLSPNLSLLLGTGCSVYAGAKTINGETNAYDAILDSLKTDLNDTSIDACVDDIKDPTLRTEQKIDRLSKLACFYDEVRHDSIKAGHVYSCINKLKVTFIDDCIKPLDYSDDMITPHKAFIKRLVSRPANLKKANLFTTNYDLLIEKACEAVEVIYSNGFIGFHNRVFSPSSFNLSLHINTDKPTFYSKGINLYKLHGSISWRYSEANPTNPYGLEEVQICSPKLEDSELVRECIIYPVQTKKSHSLDLPYSELFRQFIETLHAPTSTLIIIGYSFLDEHINDLIGNALLKPDFHLVVFSYQHESELSDAQLFLKGVFKRARSDPRITVFSGRFLGDFESVAEYLMPYIKESSFEQTLLDTFKELRGQD